jgi:hypothetical protein
MATLQSSAISPPGGFADQEKDDFGYLFRAADPPDRERRRLTDNGNSPSLREARRMSAL